jgi:hypothetical protein
MDLPDEMGAENTRMISRMILVGLVAVLGVSFPSQSESGGWLTSAHDWVVAQLAEWDTYMPGDECCIVVTEVSESSPRVLTPAAGRTSTTASVAFQPIPTVDDGANRIADELNRFGESPDIPATTTATAESPTDFAAVSSCDSIELKLAVELCRTAEAPARDETIDSPALPGLREAEEDPAFDDLFADASDVFAPAEQGLAAIAQPVPAAIAARPAFELIRPLADFESDTAAELNRLAEGLGDVPSRPAQAGTFEPIKVPADLELGIAYELNRASEGLESAVPGLRKLGEARPPIPANAPAALPEDNRKDASIGKALGLTRDAALAWMNVLSGMTPVMVTSQ